MSATSLTWFVGPSAEFLKTACLNLICFFYLTLFFWILIKLIFYTHACINIIKFFFRFFYVMNIYTHKIHGSPMTPVISAHDWRPFPLHGKSPMNVLGTSYVELCCLFLIFKMSLRFSNWNISQLLMQLPNFTF